KSVLEQKLQIGFSLPPFDRASFDVFLYKKKKIGLLVGNKHPFSKRSSITLKELKDKNIIALNNNMYPQTKLIELCAENGVDLNVQLNCPDNVLVYDLCKTNQFVSFFAGSAESFDDLITIEIEDVELFIEFYIIVNKHAYINQAAEQFLRYAQNALITDNLS
ncbi:MAG: LysR family transcriptional regulator substrate-binding protein, partial [Treponema sp.]|nr:LysR family transcriptional regulator substrate-binding protein [Treponema sp.]